MNKLAEIISVLLGPHVWLPAIFIAAIFSSHLNQPQLITLLPSIVILQVIIPLAYLYIAPKIGLASAWDLPKRKERYLFLAVISISSIMSLLLIYSFGTKLLFHLNLLLFILLLVLFEITLRWKISLHISLNTTGAILINFLFGWNLLFLFLAIPLIFWARLTLKKHTAWQLLAGILISASFMLVGLKLVGY